MGARPQNRPACGQDDADCRLCCKIHSCTSLVYVILDSKPNCRPFRPSGLVFEKCGSAAPGGRACQTVIIRHLRDSLQAIGFRQPGYAIPSIAGPSVQSTTGRRAVKTAIRQCQPGAPALGPPARVSAKDWPSPSPARGVEPVAVNAPDIRFTARQMLQQQSVFSLYVALKWLKKKVPIQQ